MSDKKFANLDRKSLDRLNDMQHEITDAEGKGVILVAFDHDCGGCKGGCRVEVNVSHERGVDAPASQVTAYHAEVAGMRHALGGEAHDVGSGIVEL